MAKPSMSIPDEILNELDDQIWELQKEEVLPRGNMRSAFVAAIIDDWNKEDTLAWLYEQHPELLAEDERKNGSRATVTAD